MVELAQVMNCHRTIALVHKPCEMATIMDQQQANEETDCLYCRRSRKLPPPRLSISGRRPTAAAKKNVPTTKAR